MFYDKYFEKKSQLKGIYIFKFSGCNKVTDTQKKIKNLSKPYTN